MSSSSFQNIFAHFSAIFWIFLNPNNTHVLSSSSSFTLPIGHSIRIRKEEEEEEEGCKMMTGKVRFATYREKK